jgi:hypothetical protein
MNKLKEIIPTIDLRNQIKTKSKKAIGEKIYSKKLFQ